jgi:hypothetical protein
MLFYGHYAKAGRTDLALASARKALALAENRGDMALADTIKAQIAGYQAQAQPK